MPKVILSDDQVRQIRTRYVINREYMNDLAQEYGVTAQYVWNIVVGNARMNAGGPLHELGGPRRKLRRDMSGTKNPNCLNDLLPEDRDLIRKLVKDGATIQAVSDIMGISRSRASRIVHGIDWADRKL